MLKTAADFPHAGSFALYVDNAAAIAAARRAGAHSTPLLRAERRPPVLKWSVSFPLRHGASGTKRCASPTSSTAPRSTATSAASTPTSSAT
jgi:hypothetical protein